MKNRFVVALAGLITLIAVVGCRTANDGVRDDGRSRVIQNLDKDSKVSEGKKAR
jgi:hypothetical protein